MSDPNRNLDPSLDCFSFSGRSASVFSDPQGFGATAQIISLLSGLGVFVNLLCSIVFGPLLYGLALVAAIPGIWVNAAFLARRAHDIGWSAKWPLFWSAIAIGLLIVALFLGLGGNLPGAVISFFTGSIIALIFAGMIYAAPGTPGPNKYGPDPWEAK
jgi:uncharacterized membrane protein YhaH (DUF805 family)